MSSLKKKEEKLETGYERRLSSHAEIKGTVGKYCKIRVTAGPRPEKYKDSKDNTLRTSGWLLVFWLAQISLATNRSKRLKYAWQQRLVIVQPYLR
jgi:hypothetical protein